MVGHLRIRFIWRSHGDRGRTGWIWRGGSRRHGAVILGFGGSRGVGGWHGVVRVVHIGLCGRLGGIWQSRIFQTRRMRGFVG